ncbi:pentapeptide repeat-containing protein [Thalassospira sp. HJ]|uniref:pentapeptide repeat-containing protein n=1 Tax=Thalassospira sp. HJ TaxID=1616823 RepID=UPI0006963E26|nr:pentapeptide repeat-containing protein [Thalassospira sp. HJ]
MRREKSTLVEWLRLKRELNFSENAFLGGLLGFVLLLFVFTLVALSIAVLGMLVVMVVDAGVLPSAERAESIRNLGLLLAATVGLPFLVWRSIVAQKQVSIAEQGHITDRINEAVKGLGSEKVVKEYNKVARYKKRDGWPIFDDNGRPIPVVNSEGEHIEDVENVEVTVPNLEVRLGSIYSLERIALDSLRDHKQIMEIFCAYVRENTPRPLNAFEPRPKIRVDVQAVITVVGRRTRRQIESEWENKFRLDFSGATLDGAVFSGGDFSGAKFHSASLTNADFSSARLLGTQFQGAFLNYASFWGAELIGTDFSGIWYTAPEHTYLGFSNSYGICLAGADITALNGFGSRETGSSFGDGDTKLNPVLDKERQKVYSIVKKFRAENEFEDWHKVLDLDEVRDSEFKHWSPDGADDYFQSVAREDILKLFNLNGFPYADD